MTTQVDQAEIKLGQILTITLSSLSYYLDNINILMTLGFIFLISGTLLRPLSPFLLLYRYIIKPLHIMNSDYQLDNIEAHMFGQLIGAITVASAVVFMQFNYELIGWSIVFVLISLTLISYSGWCIGCFLYYQLNRLGLRGFFKQSPIKKSL